MESLAANEWRPYWRIKSSVLYTRLVFLPNMTQGLQVIDFPKHPKYSFVLFRPLRMFLFHFLLWSLYCSFLFFVSFLFHLLLVLLYYCVTFKKSNLRDGIQPASKKAAIAWTREYGLLHADKYCRYHLKPITLCDEAKHRFGWFWYPLGHQKSRPYNM